jgi:hypothetical protein
MNHYIWSLLTSTVLLHSGDTNTTTLVDCYHEHSKPHNPINNASTLGVRGGVIQFVFFPFFPFLLYFSSVRLLCWPVLSHTRQKPPTLLSLSQHRTTPMINRNGEEGGKIKESSSTVRINQNASGCCCVGRDSLMCIDPDKGSR